MLYFQTLLNFVSAKLHSPIRLLAYPHCHNTSGYVYRFPFLLQLDLVLLLLKEYS